MKSPVPVDCVSIADAAAFTDQRHGRAGNGRALRIRDGADDGAGRLRKCMRLVPSTNSATAASARILANLM